MPMPRLLSTAEASEVLGVSESTLRWWRQQGTGPRWARVGKKNIKYAEPDIEVWWKQQMKAANAERRGA